MLRGRDAVHAFGHAAGERDLAADLGPRQHAAVAGLGTLRELHLDHLHLWIGGVGDEALLAETPGHLAAAEVARADFPHQVAAAFAVVGRDRAFPGVVVEAALACTVVERTHRTGRQRAEAHRRDVEHAGVVWLRSALAPHAHAKVVGL